MFSKSQPRKKKAKRTPAFGGHSRIMLIAIAAMWKSSGSSGLYSQFMESIHWFSTMLATGKWQAQRGQPDLPPLA